MLLYSCVMSLASWPQLSPLDVEYVMMCHVSDNGVLLEERWVNAWAQALHAERVRKLESFKGQAQCMRQAVELVEQGMAAMTLQARPPTTTVMLMMLPPSGRNVHSLPAMLWSHSVRGVGST